MLQKLHNLNDLSNKVFALNKTEDLNIHVFNMITEIDKSKILTKHLSCNYHVNVNVSGIMINAGVSAKIQKNLIHDKKHII